MSRSIQFKEVRMLFLFRSINKWDVRNDNKNWIEENTNFFSFHFLVELHLYGNCMSQSSGSYRIIPAHFWPTILSKLKASQLNFANIKATWAQCDLVSCLLPDNPRHRALLPISSILFQLHSWFTWFPRPGVWMGFFMALIK